MSSPRYALYFTPAPSSPWRAFGAAWLGRCAIDAGWREQPRMEGLDAAAFRRLTEAPARYGFHATLKAPFHLAAGRTVAEFGDELDRFCAARQAFVLPVPQAQQLKHFMALTWPAANTRVDAIAADCVRQFDRFRAPLAPRELERRRLAGLSAREEALLLRWGYPHVFDQFRFHLSLTGALGALPAHHIAAILDAARARIAALRNVPLVFDAVSLFEEASAGAPFRVLQRSALRAPRGRLIYLAGPSGAGKDSLIGYARAHLAPGVRVRFAQRVITREATLNGAAGGEAHLAATPEEFAQREERGEFAMVWHANGHAYGIGNEILAWLAAGNTVVVTGSRAHAAQAAAEFPGMELVLISASPAVLRQRLLARGRENAAAIEARLARNAGADAALPDGAQRICNDGELDVAGAQLLTLLL